ncbi:putative serine/threonine-protein kinase YabT [Cohnella xylanilytica]|uniref:serine/threonine protein kinase n=1 Tax=Cohnella xylanilytica TaxID=557555 RepID=UPI001B10E842|nr:serine/threonine protein kinase [Cohnella xylanilytica]GIO16258.1 putative serine/threonine-protein kinase YabT [Cohnella xylanilytica]
MITSSEKQHLPPGTVLSGKWNGRSYRVEKLLGIGSNGQVYLVGSGRSTYALKIGNETAELQAEANVLASLDRRERGRPPFLLDVDDAAVGGREASFYVMQYVPGVPVRSYLRQHGEQWFGVIGYRLLKRLSELHAAGWAFGDLKNDNILVGSYGRVALVDFGGMTAMGRGVRQFTEIYDRGYWAAGTRTADPAYDWFAFAVLWIHVLDGKRLMNLTRTLLPQNRHPRELLALVRTNAALKPMESWIERALEGRFRDTDEARELWRAQLQAAQGVKGSDAARVPGWMKGLFALSALLCASAAAFWLLK